MVQQIYRSDLGYGTNTWSATDTKDVFFFFCVFYWKLNLKSKFLLEATSKDRTLINI